MKYSLVLCILVVAIAGLEAAPHAQRLDWYQVQRILFKEVGDIWTNCSKPSDPAKIDSVTITPDPPVKGKNVTVKATATLSEQVTNGEVKVKVKYGIIPLPTITLKLCDLAKQAGLPCPIASGYHTIELTQAIPSEIPSGHYTGKAEVTDQNGNELACIDIDLHLK